MQSNEMILGLTACPWCNTFMSLGCISAAVIFTSLLLNFLTRSDYIDLIQDFEFSQRLPQIVQPAKTMRLMTVFAIICLATCDTSGCN